MESSGGIPGVRVTLCGPQSSEKPPTIKWDGASFLNNMEYTKDGIRAWRVYNVGKGRFIPWSEFNIPNTYVCPNAQHCSKAYAPYLVQCGQGKAIFRASTWSSTCSWKSNSKRRWWWQSWLRWWKRPVLLSRRGLYSLISTVLLPSKTSWLWEPLVCSRARNSLWQGNAGLRCQAGARRYCRSSGNTNYWYPLRTTTWVCFAKGVGPEVDETTKATVREAEKVGCLSSGCLSNRVHWSQSRTSFGSKINDRGGSRGRVQGVRTPPPEIKFRTYVFTFKNFLAHCQWRHSLEVHPCWEKSWIRPWMRKSKNSDGSLLFYASEFLIPQEIANFFSRSSAKRVLPTDDEAEDEIQEDLREAKEEKN